VIIIVIIKSVMRQIRRSMPQPTFQSLLVTLVN